MKSGGIVEQQKKRRHLSLLDEVRSGKTLSPGKIQELDRYENAAETVQQAEAQTKPISRPPPKRPSKRTRTTPSTATPEVCRKAATLLAVGKTPAEVAEVVGLAESAVQAWLESADFKKTHLDPALEQVGIVARAFILPGVNGVTEAVLNSLQGEASGIGPLTQETVIDSVTGQIVDRRMVGMSFLQKVTAIEKLQQIAYLALDRPAKSLQESRQAQSSADLETLITAWRASKLKDPLGTLLAEQESVKNLLKVAEERRRKDTSFQGGQSSN